MGFYHDFEMRWNGKRYQLECENIEITDTHVENDSIGSYEFWGVKEYDNQPDYLIATDIEIDWTQVAIVEIFSDAPKDFEYIDDFEFTEEFKKEAKEWCLESKGLSDRLEIDDEPYID